MPKAHRRDQATIETIRAAFALASASPDALPATAAALRTSVARAAFAKSGSHADRDAMFAARRREVAS